MDKARILVVDDTPANLEILGDLLKPEYHVHLALNGLDALKLASSDTAPDLLLLDIMMPGLDGYQVCEALKAREETRHIPIIFVTAVTDIESEEKGLSLGAVDYITKPFTPSIVLARVKTHLKLHNQTRHLQSLVKERTAELEKARLEAEAANRAKSVFLANMSHELRTPLNGVMGMTQLLLASNPSKEQAEFLKTTQLSSAHLLAMVNDLLELANAEAGATHLEPSPCNLRQSLRHVINHYQRRAEAKGLDFDAAFGDDVPEEVRVDGNRTRQVLMNILNNALRFTDQGCIRLSVHAWEGAQKADSDNKLNLIFTVKDTGVGIDPKQREHMFDPFVIGEDYLTKKYSGAGLGLSISKKLVALMGGDIWLEDSQEDGTVCNFTVPCDRSALVLE
ncbi:MAG: two-component system, sensor histidine kinase [Desulfovibrionales bacterium]|jgi:signal transduction histidine kinase|nr:two-component system, sensor histidine kinase [Desulfovibrionales bacterium]